MRMDIKCVTFTQQMIWHTQEPGIMVIGAVWHTTWTLNRTTWYGNRHMLTLKLMIIV
jgi:hypothetical protein